MTTHDPGPDPLHAAADLTAAIDGMTAELRTVNARQAAVEAYGRRNRLLIFLTFTYIAAVAVLTVLLVLVNGAAQAAATRADTANVNVAAQHQSLLISCRNGNISRAAQVALWDHVLSQTTSNLNLNTAAGRHLFAYIQAAFRPRNCEATYRLP